uniref:DOMON domain-containing protein n=1 Tax=Phlebotomus papatasi TaxID=29031 RepID=A0A1B0DQ20_PHLPP
MMGGWKIEEVELHYKVSLTELNMLRDRHVKKNSDGEPVVDPSQDYVLLLGYENATHTVLRFRRKLDTCDTYHDLPITVSV